ncbi:MAG TPA: hypothetical protein VMS17_30335, partial [Gemmataceae bacterium]|nr:hypothetical protein [Gemmataceae bacterium]
MSLIASSFVALLVLAADEPAPKFPLGKDTTYVSGPLDQDGYIDYEAALNDRLGKGITPETNANVLLWKAFGPTPEGGPGTPAEVFKRMGIDEPPKDGAYFIGLDALMKDHLKLDPSQFDAIYDQQMRAGKRPWTAKDYPHIAEWLEANEKPLAIVVEATRRPDYYNPLISRRKENEPGSLINALLPSVQKCRAAAAALTARAMFRAGTGKFDEAWQDLLACHRLGRLVARGGTLIEALVGIAVDQMASNADLAYLERADLTATQIQDRMKDLQGLAPLPPMADKIDLLERFTYLESVGLIRRGGLGVLEGLSGGSAKKPDADQLKVLEKIDWEPALRNGNQWYDRLAAASRLKDRAERRKEFDKIDEDLKALKKEAGESANLAKLLSLLNDPPEKTAGKAIGDVLICLLVPAVSKVQNAYDRDDQVQRNVQIAFALAAYRRDHGSYPAKLDDLAPKYLPAVPNDIFSGGPLVYHPSDKGYLFYSVGVNGRDEGGRSFEDDPPGDDLPVSMPLPELKAKK